MSDQQVRLATLLLQESFGEVVEKAASFLMRHGSSPLAEVIHNTELTPVQVTYDEYVRALCKKYENLYICRLFFHNFFHVTITHSTEVYIRDFVYHLLLSCEPDLASSRAVSGPFSYVWALVPRTQAVADTRLMGALAVPWSSSSSPQVKKSLCVLIQHQLVSSSQHEGGRTLYTIDVSCVHARLRFPRYIHAAKELFGDVGELVVEDLLQHGQSLMSEVNCGCRLWACTVCNGWGLCFCTM